MSLFGRGQGTTSRACVCLGFDANTQARSDGAGEGRQVDGAGYEGGHAETDHIKHKYAGSTGQTGREVTRPSIHGS